MKSVSNITKNYSIISNNNDSLATMYILSQFYGKLTELSLNLE